MNWLDIVLLVVAAIATFRGFRSGLIGPAFAAAGVFAGWQLASHWSDDVGELFGDSLQNDTLATVASYAIIIVAAVAVSSIAAKIVRPMLSASTLGLSGMVDKLGGLALGLLIGAAISGAVIIGLARLTYNFDVSAIAEATGVIPVQFPGQMPHVTETEVLTQVEDVRVKLEAVLTESQAVSIFVKVTESLPASTLGLVPSDFKVALDILAKNIE